MTTRTRYTVVLLSAPVLAFIVVGTLLGRRSSASDMYPHLKVFDDVFSLTTNAYVEKVDIDRLMHGAMHGLADALDADSAYLSPEEVHLAAAASSLPAGELGIELTRQYYLRVIAVRDGSPAARAGMRTGDYLRMIGDDPTRDMSVWEGMRRLRGAPGTMVTLTVIRGNAAEPHVIDVTREVLAPLGPASRMVADGIGFVRVPEFTDLTSTALRTEMARLQENGAGRVILDVRGCARGKLPAGLEAARIFVAGGTLGQLETRGSDTQVLRAAPGDGAVTLPLAVLVDAGTSGAAELFVAALAGAKRAEVIGERTIGRAAVQRLFPLPDGGALWMSYAWYLSPGGDPIHGRGIAPEVAVPQPDVEFGAAPPAGDATIDKAVDRLRARPVR
ncbi:MAG: S41 family peptidase [Acidobacteriota bacterium]